MATFLGIIVGASLTLLGTILYHAHRERTDLFKRLLAFYKSRIESFRAVEGSLAEKFSEPEIDTARAPLRAELLLIAPHHILDREQELYEYVYDRELQRKMLMRLWREERTQTTMRIGKGANENMAMDSAIVKHAYALFDKAYSDFVNTLRREMSFWETLKAFFFISPTVQVPTRFSVHNAMMRIRERMFNDPESVEAIWRGRIADQMRERGGTPFDIYVCKEMDKSSGACDLMVELIPPTPRLQGEGDKLVFGALGYDHIWYYCIERLNECKEGVREYFNRVPEGKVVLKGRSKDDQRRWDNLIEANKDDFEKLYEYIDRIAQDYSREQSETLESEEKKWADVLRKAGKEIPELPE